MDTCTNGSPPLNTHSVSLSYNIHLETRIEDGWERNVVSSGKQIELDNLIVSNLLQQNILEHALLIPYSGIFILCISCSNQYIHHF